MESTCVTARPGDFNTPDLRNLTESTSTWAANLPGVRVGIWFLVPLTTLSTHRTTSIGSVVVIMETVKLNSLTQSGDR